MKKRHLLAGAGLVAASLLAPAAPAQSICGEVTNARAGETLADVAERCDVTVEALRDANPGVVGEPAAGVEIAMPDSADGDLVGRAGDLLRDAGSEIERAAREAGESVADYLDSNPDVGRDIREFGERHGLWDFSDAPAQGEAAVTVIPASPEAGEEVTITATGLPAGAEADIGLGPSRTDYEIVTQASADDAGRIETTLTLPDWVSAAESIVFVVETPRMALRSDPVEMAAGQ